MAKFQGLQFVADRADVFIGRATVVRDRAETRRDADSLFTFSKVGAASYRGAVRTFNAADADVSDLTSFREHVVPNLTPAMLKNALTPEERGWLANANAIILDRGSKPAQKTAARAAVRDILFDVTKRLGAEAAAATK